MPDDLGEVIVEATRNGTYLKVTAVHVATGIEASAVGPAMEPKAVERLAIAKLRRLIATS
ncbi:DUF6898 family protein [Brevundimonas aurifodinae]|uniref:DUF6898 domain-containing protein n=2 Tax=Brevundimonas TaxID=41275 RepID=A0ABV1NP41_9CAUL|nr:MAG: hypothetical protein B7Z42_11395 [Brevundimonas sp. 12-68-7]OYX31205.1 MAG: hypothetical protein B7Z01_12965 [Brevundimonas subvibrioides]